MNKLVAVIRDTSSRSSSLQVLEHENGKHISSHNHQQKHRQMHIPPHLILSASDLHHSSMIEKSSDLKVSTEFFSSPEKKFGRNSNHFWHVIFYIPSREHPPTHLSYHQTYCTWYITSQEVYSTMSKIFMSISSTEFFCESMSVVGDECHFSQSNNQTMVILYDS